MRLYLEVPVKLIDISTKKYPNTFAKVDDEDFEYLSQWKWRPSNCGKLRPAYAIRLVYIGGGKTKPLRMHREVIKTKAGMFTDHINGDTLDNRKKNLRQCTLLENSRNKRSKRGATGFKGVQKRHNAFVARIRVSGVRIYLGYFKSAIEAAKAYDTAAVKHFGDFAEINFAIE